MDRLVLQVEVDLPFRGQREGMQVGIGRPIGVRLEARDRIIGTRPRAEMLTPGRGEGACGPSSGGI